MPRLTMRNNHLKKFLDLDPDVDDFQNLISSSLSTETSLVKFSQRSHVSSFYAKLFYQTNDETNRQMLHKI